jgi:hypothetical protein
MSGTRRQIAAVSAAGGLMLGILLVPGDAMGGRTGWSRVECQRAFIAWFHQHPKAMQAHQKAYMRLLNARHGCSFRYA